MMNDRCWKNGGMRRDVGVSENAGEQGTGLRDPNGRGEKKDVLVGRARR